MIGRMQLEQKQGAGIHFARRCGTGFPEVDLVRLQPGEVDEPVVVSDADPEQHIRTRD